MKKIVSFLLAALALFAIALSLVSCGGEVNKAYYYEYFDTFSIISDYSGSSKRKFEKNTMRVEELLREYHELFDIYNEYEGINNLASINAMAGKGAVKVDERIIEMLLYAKEMYKLTEGEVNVAFGSVLKIWHNYRSDGKSLPKRAELLAASRHTDINDLIIDKEAGTVEIVDPKMSLDVGAIAKGYAVEKIAEALIEWGLESWVIDVGGNLRVVGAKPDGSGWRTGVKNPTPTESEPYIAYYEIKNEAIVTSGNYERYYEVGGLRYHHIIDKDTLYPSEHCASVTVKTENSALADALSTAIFNMETEKARELVSKLKGAVEVLIVLEDGEKIELKYTEEK